MQGTSRVIGMMVGLGLLGACAAEIPPEPEPEIEFGPLVQELSGSAGWDPLTGGTFQETTWAWDEGEGRFPRGEWVPADTERVAEERIAWRAESAEGRVVELARPDWPDQPDLATWWPTETLAPGRWTIIGTVDGVEQARLTHAVTEHGQLDGLDLVDLDGAVFLLEDGLGRLEPRGIQSVVLGGGELEPMVLRLREAESDWTLQVFAPGEQGLCRAFTGPVQIDGAGLVTADTEAIVAQAGLPVAFEDVSLEVGLGPGADSVAGVEIRGLLDTRTLDAALVDTDEGEVVEGGEAAQFLRQVGYAPFDCTGEGVDSCMHLAVFGGVGDRVSEAGLVEAFAPPETWTTLDEVPPCQGVSEGQVCSTLGTAGIVGWLGAVGLVLVRRRRRGGENG